MLECYSTSKENLALHIEYSAEKLGEAAKHAPNFKVVKAIPLSVSLKCYFSQTLDSPFNGNTIFWS